MTNYRASKYRHQIVDVDNLTPAIQSEWHTTLAVGINAGLGSGFEGWIRIPFEYSYIKKEEGSITSKYNDLRVGDIASGIRYLIKAEDDFWPAVTGSLSVTAPTGNSPYKNKSTLDGISDGGHWVVDGGLGFVKSVDPAVLFWGVEYSQSVTEKYNSVSYKPGSELRLYGGLGFAINDRLSVSSRLTAVHQNETKVDENSVTGSTKDSFDLGLGLSYRAWDLLTVSPEFTFGLNEDANDFAFSLTATKSL